MAVSIAQIKSNLHDIKPHYEGAEKVCKLLEDYVNQNGFSIEYTRLISFLTSELSAFYELEEHVNPLADGTNFEAFLFEVSGFLQEYGCPYTSLKSGDINSRLSTKQNRILLLFFLTSELLAAKMHFASNPENQIPGSLDTNGANGSTSGSIFHELDLVRQGLGMVAPPANITNQMYFSSLEKKLGAALKQIPADVLSRPIFSKQLGPAHWEKIEAINEALVAEYSTRRSMLLKRLDVTIASFGWSDRAKSKFEEIAQVYQKQRHRLSSESTVSIAHLIAAREDLSQMSKTVSGETRHACAINRVRMGRVPDRGGRTNEIEAPPPEMPSWQKRQDDGGRGGHRGRGRGGFNNSRGRGGGGYHTNNGGRPNTAQQGGRPHSGQQGGRPQSAGGRGVYTNSNRGQSRWSRGGQSHPGQGSGAFEQVFGGGNRGGGRGGFAQGRYSYTS